MIKVLCVYRSFCTTRIKTAIPTEAQVPYTNVYFYCVLVIFRASSNTGQLISDAGRKCEKKMGKFNEIVLKQYEARH